MRTKLIFSMFVSLIAAGMLITKPANAEVQMSEPNAYRYSFTMMDGTSVPLSNYEGKVLLVVNTASQCGFTPQYAGLQELHQNYADKGLVIIGVPSADFGGQEFDSEDEVKKFTEEKFEVTFPLTEISHVSGDEAIPFYMWARDEAGMLGGPKWNFHKYLIDKKGNFVASYASATTPTSAELVTAIEKELAK